MEIKRFEGTGRMSRVVEFNKTLYLCGQTCSDVDSIEEQTKCVLKKIEDLLLKYGSDRKHIISTTIYLRNISDFDKMNVLWDDWVIDGFEPARACVEAKMARENILVEMSVVAAVK
ncbi:RidA family protein [Helicovermis profundi]|uniref:RidA family protein n=1 Tax=Helicovermis profundi TaxID=3065157 RepID=A0AAU9E3T8_9FIRM|nr:RidA family protein [Clostridia bacterium S502]